MAQFEVPQFIDIESKVVGPLTLRQFIFIAVPSLISFFLFFVLKMFVWVIVTVVFVSFGVALAFLKINGQPFYKIVIVAFRYFWGPKLLLWRKPKIEETFEIAEVERKRTALELANEGISRISNLWKDIMTRKQPIPKREKVVPKGTIAELQEQYQVFKKITGEKEIARRVDYR